MDGAQVERDSLALKAAMHFEPHDCDVERGVGARDRVADRGGLKGSSGCKDTGKLTPDSPVASRAEGLCSLLRYEDRIETSSLLCALVQYYSHSSFHHIFVSFFCAGPTQSQGTGSVARLRHRGFKVMRSARYPQPINCPTYARAWACCSITCARVQGCKLQQIAGLFASTFPDDARSAPVPCCEPCPAIPWVAAFRANV